MFDPYTLYKHNKNTDVAFEPIFTEYSDEGADIVVVWWNVTSDNPNDWFVIDRDKISILKSKFAEWPRIATMSGSGKRLKWTIF